MGLEIPPWAFELLFPAPTATRPLPEPIIFSEFGMRVLKERAAREGA
jgi:hypothetical protein